MKKYTKKKVTEFLMESNAIEGVYDAASLKEAQEAWDYLIEEDKMTPYVVLKTHEILMRNKKLLPTEIGYLRRVPVWIGGHKGMNHEYIAKAVMDWCFEMNQDLKCDDVLCTAEWSRQLHVTYEKIHPFVDGNGRTGRMFMNWWRWKNGLPILIIHEGDEQWEYYNWFKD